MDTRSEAPPTRPPPFLDLQPVQPPRIASQQAAECFARAFRAERLDDLDFAGYVLDVAYRTTRYRLHLTGTLHLDEPLRNSKIDWQAPLSTKNPPIDEEEQVVFADALAQLQERPTALDPAASHNGTLEAWRQQTYTIAVTLRAHGSTQKHPYGSPRVLKQLLEPSILLAHWPTPADIHKHERALVRKVTKFLEESITTALEKLQEEEGYTEDEAIALIRLAKRHVLALYEGSVEEERALERMRLESLRARARRALLVRDELMAGKALHIVQGFARTEPEDLQLEFRQLVAKVSTAKPPVDPQPNLLDVQAEPSRPSEETP